MMLRRVAKYLTYIILSRHRAGHGIHSPFVFGLINHLFRNKTDNHIVSSIEKIRKRLRSDHRYINVTDLGSGPVKHKNISRKVSDIIKYSAVSKKHGALLSSLAAEFGNQLIVEFGTSFGISTMYMAASTVATVFTIEGCKETAEIARQNFKEAGLNNIKLFEGPFDEVLPDLEETCVSPGLVFIDGNHRKGPVVKYFNKLAEISSGKTVIIIDDINYSNEMAEAWNEIKLHEKVSVSIDLFRMGIVFFREGINHNDYIIRY